MTNLNQDYVHVEDMPAPIVNDDGFGAEGEREVVIAVMGVTGAGKSFMIRQMTGQDVLVGDGLAACTQNVKGVRFRYRGVNITLLDSPGFNDTYRTDTDILYDISGYLSDTYAQGFKLSGIIYLHPISHPRMEGSSLLSLRMFRKLVGDDALGNVILATTHWGRVSAEEGERRERDLRDKFWRPLVEQGAQMARYDPHTDAGTRLLDALVRKERVVLDIQRELVDEGKPLIETAAGYALNEELVKVTKTYEARLERTKKELGEAMDKALKDQSEQSQRELADVRSHAAQLQGQIAAAREQQRKLKEQERLAARDAQQMMQQMQMIQLHLQKQKEEQEEQRKKWEKEKTALAAQVNQGQSGSSFAESMPYISSMLNTAANAFFMYLNSRH